MTLYINLIIIDISKIIMFKYSGEKKWREPILKYIFRLYFLLKGGNLISKKWKEDVNRYISGIIKKQRS